MKTLLCGLALLAALTVWTPFACAQDALPEVTDKKPNPTVTFAKTWEEAVAEAKLLNVPIVVHSHGFF